MFRVPNSHRIRNGQLASDDSYGNNGAFYLPIKRANDRSVTKLLCIASDQDGWEHVSCSPNKPRCPYWDEMAFVKQLFWDEEDAVIQIHPPRSQHIDCHPYALHLWRKVGTNHFFEAPPSWMVGPPGPLQ